jgi:hypothetical protein
MRESTSPHALGLTSLLMPANLLLAPLQLPAERVLSVPPPPPRLALPGSIHAEQETYEAFFHACRQMMTHRQALAYPVLEDFILRHVDFGTPNAALLSHIMAESLFKRLDSNLLEGKNIYVQSFDIPQIKMFYKMAKALPHVFVSHDIANQHLAQGMRETREVTFLELGIGKGVQLWKLLTLLMLDWNCRVEHVRVIGVDPDPANLEDTGASLAKLRKILPFNITYQPVCNVIEEIPEHDLSAMVGGGGENLFINAAFTLHHTYSPPDNKTTRLRLFQRLAKLRPRTFTLIEPHSDHDTESLSRRFHHAWNHFGTIFDLIDQSELSPGERFIIKEKFFGREVRDIFGSSDRFRCERHELYETWLLRFARAGFKPITHFRPELNLPETCEAETSDGMVRLGFAGTCILSVFAQTMC